MPLNERAKNVRFIEGLRKQSKTRKRDAILLGSIGVVLLCAAFFSGNGVENTVVRARETFAKVDNCSPTVIKKEIWLAYALAVIHAKMYVKALFCAGFGGFGIGMMFTRLFGRKREFLIMLWDRTNALEAQLGASGSLNHNKQPNQDS